MAEPYRCPAAIQVEELLGRDSVPPDPQLLGPGITGNVFVSPAQAGQSVRALPPDLGAETEALVLQAQRQVFTIHQELSHQQPGGVELVPGSSATDKA